MRILLVIFIMLSSFAANAITDNEIKELRIKKMVEAGIITNKSAKQKLLELKLASKKNQKSKSRAARKISSITTPKKVYKFAPNPIKIKCKK